MSLHSIHSYISQCCQVERGGKLAHFSPYNEKDFALKEIILNESKERITHVIKNKNIISFSELMNSQDKYVLIGLSKFCKIVMSIFKP